jgi:hypothetical protein
MKVKSGLEVDFFAAMASFRGSREEGKPSHIGSA